MRLFGLVLVCVAMLAGCRTETRTTHDVRASNEREIHGSSGNREFTPEENVMRAVQLKFSLLDTNRDGALSFAEFMGSQVARQPGGAAIFDVADVNGDGFLTPEEVEAWVLESQAKALKSQGRSPK
ncbi:MAG: hypothetical protein PF961_08305 [Planctomycetota bacterium]|jgi:hypothetical protein|nr:hypothetical protein [Planctomycetota bacterium]